MLSTPPILMMMLAIRHTNTDLPFLRQPFKNNSSSTFWTTYATVDQEIRHQDHWERQQFPQPSHILEYMFHLLSRCKMKWEYSSLNNERKWGQFCQFYWTNKIPTNNNEINSAGINVIQFNKTHCSVPINRFSKCHKKCSYELLTG